MVGAYRGCGGCITKKTVTEARPPAEPPPTTRFDDRRSETHPSTGNPSQRDASADDTGPRDVIPDDVSTTWDDVPATSFDDAPPTGPSPDVARQPVADPPPRARDRGEHPRDDATIERVRRVFPGRVLDVAPQATGADPAEDESDAQVE